MPAWTSIRRSPSASPRWRPGSWMRLLDEEGEEGSVKVAWISPLTSRLLLVNRRGVRKLVASPQQLAALVKAGKLVAGTDEPAVRRGHAPGARAPGPGGRPAAA